MKYKIWDKKETLVTPIGEVLTAEQVIKRYPSAGIDGMDFIICDSNVQLGVFMELEQTRAVYKNKFVDMANSNAEDTKDTEKATLEVEFDAMTNEEFLEALDYYEENQPEADATAEERIASALEFQNLLAMDDVE